MGKKCSNKACKNALVLSNGCLPLSEFNESGSNCDGLKSWCKDCSRASRRKSYEINNLNEVRYRNSHKKESKLYRDEYYLKNKEQIISDTKEYIKLHPEIKKISNKNWYLKNKDYYSAYSRERYNNDINYKLNKRLRTRLSDELRKNIVGKSFRTFDLLGLPIQDFKVYIENKFLPGMSWENWGKYTWHLDHIIPLSSFDLTDPEQQKKAFNYANYQPLWAKDNLQKGSKLNWVKTH